MAQSKTFSYILFSSFLLFLFLPAIVCKITYTPGSAQRRARLLICVYQYVCAACKQKTLVCQFELENFCLEISQKWVVNVESAWYAVDNFQMAAICKAIWKRNGNMRNNLHSRAIFTSAATAIFWSSFLGFISVFCFDFFFFLLVNI